MRVLRGSVRGGGQPPRRLQRRGRRRLLHAGARHARLPRQARRPRDREHAAMKWWRALASFVGESLEALVADDREEIRRQQIEQDLKRRRWHDYLYSRPP